jgi:hypothetical protein
MIYETRVAMGSFPKEEAAARAQSQVYVYRDRLNPNSQVNDWFRSTRVAIETSKLNMFSQIRDLPPVNDVKATDIETLVEWEITKPE